MKNIVLICGLFLAPVSNAQQVCEPCSGSEPIFYPSSGGDCQNISVANTCAFANSGQYGANCAVKSAGKYFNTQYRSWIRIEVPASGQINGTVMPNGNDRSFPKVTLFQDNCPLSSGDLIGCAFQSPNSCGGGYTCGDEGTLIATNLGTASYGEQFAMNGLTAGDIVYACLDWLGAGAGGDNQICLYDTVLTENAIASTPDICGATTTRSTTGSLAGFSCSGKPGNCGGGPAPSFENLSYYQVTSNAAGDDISITIDNVSCNLSNLGVQVLVYAGTTCGGLTCVTGNTASGLTAKNLTIVAPAPNTTYTMLIDGFAGSLCQFDLSTSGCQPPIPLPVELTNFKGKYNDESGMVVLTWETQSQVNSSHFVIQKSYDAIAFEDIGLEDADGTINLRVGYSFLDNSLMMGDNYYRLNIFDVDGHSEYSPIINVKTVNTSFTIGGVDNKISIDCYSNKTTEYSIVVYTYSGKVIYDRKNKIEEGENSILIPKNGDIKSGYYFISVTDGNKILGKEHVVIY
jgi:hypothetical protein